MFLFLHICNNKQLFSCFYAYLYTYSFLLPPTVVDVKTAFEKYIKALNENEQIGTVISCSYACKSLLKFKPNLEFEHLTVEFPRNYEQWFIITKTIPKYQPVK